MAWDASVGVGKFTRALFILLTGNMTSVLIAFERVFLCDFAFIDIFPCIQSWLSTQVVGKI